ncbi:MAG TPA: hypothetical protein VK995_05645, partial [Oceanipulchritudo sp.]|nr:hypothetical protein [Oceanipulchritudo sp.]
DQWLQAVHKREIPFLQACRDAQSAKAFIRPFIGELASVARSLRERWSTLTDAQQPFRFSVPGRTFQPEQRAEDLSEWKESGKLVSLDIFDTCLIRLLAKPEEIFDLLGEKVERLTGFPATEFSRLRSKVENSLRQEGLQAGTREDTCLVAIYDELGKQLSWDVATRESFLSTELELERFFLRPVPSARDRAWALFRQGRLAAYTSEMYLPADALRGLLVHCGFPVEGVEILSSGETGKSKGSGNLYRLLQDKRHGQPILHVGDNPVSDGTVPSGMGIATAVIRTGRELYPDRFSNVLHAAVEQAPPDEGDFWEAFGYRVAGPIHFAFANFLYCQCQELGRDALFFLSRDGWFPKIIFDRMQEAWGPVADSHYLYASREYFGLGSMTDIGPVEWDYLLKASPLLTARDVLARIGLSRTTIQSACDKHGLGDPDRLLCHHWGYRDPEDRDRLYAAVCDNLKEFIHYKDSIRASLTGYLDGSGIFKQSSLFVDVGWGASSLKALSQMAPDPALQPQGLYFALLSGSPAGATAYFTGGDGNSSRIALLKGSVALMEFLFGSPEPTVRLMQNDGNAWRPVFRNGWSRYDRAAWKGMETGIRRFADAVLGVQCKAGEGDGSAFVEDTLRRLIFAPADSELQNIAPVTHGEGWGTDNRLRMLPRIGKLTNPGVVHEAMCYAPWKRGLALWAGAEQPRPM